MIKTIGRRDLKTGPLCNLTDGGDTSHLSPQAIEKIRSESELKLHIVVITDDIDSAGAIIEKLAPDSVVLPDDANAWQCLALMKSADYVVAANSTLSWWGSLLCAKSGGVSYIPDPWFKNFQPNEDQAFFHPALNTIKSEFE